MAAYTPSKPVTSQANSPWTPRKGGPGLFEDGTWLCDCKPRQPAVCLTVRKENANKGRRFWTCHKNRENATSCRFFLWESDAREREREALLTYNCQSENGITTRVQGKDEAPPGGAMRSRQRIFRGLPPWPNSGSQDSESLSLSDNDDEDPGEEPANGDANISSSSSRIQGFSFQAPPSSLPPTTPSAKRKRPVFRVDNDDDEDDEFGDTTLEDSDTERQLAAITDESARKQQRQQRQSSGVTENVEHNGGLPTPRTNRNSLIITAEERKREQERERSAKRQRIVGFTVIPGKDGPRHTEGGEDPLPQPDDDDDDNDNDFIFGYSLKPTPHRKTYTVAISEEPPITPTRSSVSALPLPLPITPGTTTTTTNSNTKPSHYPRITDNVMSLLNGQPISEAKRRTVEAALAQYEQRVKGIALGRDAARAQLQARDARIAELQARVASLENARRLDRANLGDAREVLRRLTQQPEVEYGD